jgi:DNA-binding MarR family transcriptional regulator
LSLGTYHSAQSPKTSPAAQVQIHHRSSAGRLSRTISKTTSAIAHPAVTTPATSWSFASSGGGGDGRSASPRDSFTRSGYEVPPSLRAWLRGGRGRDVLTSTPKAGRRRFKMMTATQTRTDAGLATALRISVSRLARRLRAQRAASGMTEAVLSETQLAALSALEVHQAMTPGELAEHEKVQPPSMTRVIAVLEERQLVLRSPHPTDRRQVILTVTEEGRAVVQRVRRRKDAWLARRLAELTAEERATLRAAVPILEKLSQSES